jgi:hypothetical protein
MSLNESKHRSTRDRWPLEFDLEGVPRENDLREKLLREQRGLSLAPQEMEPSNMPVNSFAVDKLDPLVREELLRQLLATAPVGSVIDINNPPRQRYVHQDFPRMVYHHGSLRVLVVEDAAQLKAAQKHGYKLEPAPNADYSQIKGGIAASKQTSAPREEELTAEQLAELDAMDSK